MLKTLFNIDLPDDAECYTYDKQENVWHIKIDGIGVVSIDFKKRKHDLGTSAFVRGADDQVYSGACWRKRIIVDAIAHLRSIA